MKNKTWRRPTAQTRAAQTRAAQTRAAQTRAAQTRAAQTRAAQTRAALMAAVLALSACGDSTDTVNDNDATSTEATPGIELTVVEDPMAGHNLFIEVTDLIITPEHASTDRVDGEGHLHLYVDGERVMRFYNTAVHLGGLEPGEHTVAVEVSQNDHSAYKADGEPIRATKTITVAETGHGHGRSDVVDFEGDDAPIIEVTAAKDPKAGWNLSAVVENFTITPENASTDPVIGQGHLHLYIDGVKITRLYGTDWHIPDLSEGSHIIEVEISHNDHSAYGLDGEPIRGAATVDVSAEDAAAGGHSHSHDDDTEYDDTEYDDTEYDDTEYDDTDHDNADHDDTDHDDTDHGEMEESMAIDGADVTITALVSEGVVTTDDTRYEVSAGSTVAIVIESDSAEQVHLHGYDLFIDTTPDASASAVFTADIPGLFEVELEGSGTLLFELQVS